MRLFGAICILLAVTLTSAHVKTAAVLRFAIPSDNRVEVAQDAAQDVTALLAKAREAMGVANVSGGVLHYQASAALFQPYQSDRTYPPFFAAFLRQEAWFNPTTGVLRIQTQTQYPGGPASPASVMLDRFLRVDEKHRRAFGFSRRA